MDGRKFLFVFCFCIILIFGVTITPAQEVSYLDNPGPGDRSLWLIDPDTTEPYGQVGLYPPDSRWRLAQWGTRDRLPLQSKRFGNQWRVNNRDAGAGGLPTGDGSYIVDLMQNSGHPDYGAREFDLFLEPNDSRLPNLPSNLMHYDDQPSLGSLRALRIKAWQRLISAWHGTRGSHLMGMDGYDLASVLMALVLINPYVSPQQVLFYQIITYDSRGWLFDRLWFDQGTWSDPTMTYGISDSVETFGVSALMAGRARRYDLNILNRLKEIVLTGPSSLDKNFDRWKVGGLYLGSMVNGEATIHSRMGGIDLTFEIGIPNSGKRLMEPEKHRSIRDRGLIYSSY